MKSAAPRTGVVIGLGTAQTLAWASTYYLPAILAVPMARDLGVPPSWVFGAFSAGLVISALLGPAAGRAIDTNGGRPVLVFSSFIFTAGLALLGLTNGVVLLTLAWLMLGAGMALGLYDAAFSALAHLYGRDVRGPITGITLIAGFASTVGWPISALLEAEIGWRGACFAWAAMHLLIGLPLNRFIIPAGGKGHAAVISAQADETAEGGTAPRYAMALLAFVFAAGWFVSTAMAAHLPRLLEGMGTAPAAAVAAGALIGPAQVGARLLEFGFLRRFHPLISARLAALAHPLGAVTLFTIGGPAAALFTLLHGAGNGILTIAKGAGTAISAPSSGGRFRRWMPVRCPLHMPDERPLSVTASGAMNGWAGRKADVTASGRKRRVCFECAGPQNRPPNTSLVDHHALWSCWDLG